MEISIVNFFADTESGGITSIPPVTSNTGDNESVTLTVTVSGSESTSVTFNSDTDFANFQLGEFGVAQPNFVFHLAQTK